MTIKRCIMHLIGFSFLSANCYGFDLQVKVYDIQGNPLPEVVVYLEPLAGQLSSDTKPATIISQTEKAFSPYIGVTQVSTPVVFNNRDDITHHIYSVNQKMPFAFILQPNQQVVQTASAQTIEIAMGCNVHDWMSGHLLVVDTPYFAKTTAQGQAELSVEQSGDFRLVIWHPQLLNVDHRQSSKITLDTDQNIEVHLTTKLASIAPQQSDDDFDFLSEY